MVVVTRNKNFLSCRRSILHWATIPAWAIWATILTWATILRWALHWAQNKSNIDQRWQWVNMTNRRKHPSCLTHNLINCQVGFLCKSSANLKKEARNWWKIKSYYSVKYILTVLSLRHFAACWWAWDVWSLGRARFSPPSVFAGRRRQTELRVTQTETETHGAGVTSVSAEPGLGGKSWVGSVSLAMWT